SINTKFALDKLNSSFQFLIQAFFLESILGLKIGALQSEAEEYVSSLHRLLELAMTRIWKFWLWPDFTCHRTNDYKEALQHLRITHGFSRSIVKERKLKYMNEEMGDDSRRPKCLLDILLKLHIEDKALDEEGVRQEVDTFIVGGHDTVTVAVKWALYLIGLYPEVQERIHQELDSVLGADSKGSSFCWRSERTQIPGVRPKGGHTIPKRTTVVVTPFGAQGRRRFPDQRSLIRNDFCRKTARIFLSVRTFLLLRVPETALDACLEMEVKLLVCHILRNFSLRSLDSRDQVLPVAKITLQSSEPARIKFRRAENNE
ncbi:probable cytochrome P450 4d20, partial [Caerostris darwini]